MILGIALPTQNAPADTAPVAQDAHDDTAPFAQDEPTDADPVFAQDAHDEEDLMRQARSNTKYRMGLGVNYWRSVKHISRNNIDIDSFAWLATCQIVPAAPWKIEANIEYFHDGFLGLDGTAFAPQAFALLGSTLYAGAGIGIFYENGSFDADPFYILRAGLDFEIFPRIHMDLSGNYRFAKWTPLDKLVKNIDGNTITLGAALRVEF